MLYINFLTTKFKGKITKEVSVVITIILGIAFIAATFDTHRRFITGGYVSPLEYGLILITVYLLLNIVVAIKDESDEGKRLKAENVTSKGKNILVIDYTDTFIFNKPKLYNYRNERKPLIPTFVSDQSELIPPDETLDFLSEDLPTEFEIPDQTEMKIEEERVKDISEMTEEERRQQLRNELLNGL